MININTTSDRITGSVNGTPFSVEFSQKRYDKMVALQNKEQQAETMEEAKQIWEDFEELTTVSPKEQIETESEHLTYNPNTDTYHLKSGDDISPIPMPESLAEKLLYAVDKSLPVDPIVKFFTRLLRNPNIQEGDSEDAFRKAKRICDYATLTFVSPTLFDEYKEEGYSDEVAEEMATVPQTPLTMEGLLCTKKVVRPVENLSKWKYELDENGEKQKVLRDGWEKVIDEDTGEVTIKQTDDFAAEDLVFRPVVMGTRGDAFYMGRGEDAPLGHEIRVGQEQRLQSWDQVDCSMSGTCSKGIHAGNQHYIEGYEREGTYTLNCLYDPQDIGGVENSMIRGIGLFPVSIKDRETDNRNLYHPSHYADVGDKRWAEYRKEAVERFDEELEALKEKIAEKKKLQEFVS